MKISITRVICGAILNLNNVIKYIKFIKEQFLGTLKARENIDQNYNN